MRNSFSWNTVAHQDYAVAVFRVDVRSAQRSGLVFYKRQNGDIVTPGENGVIRPEFLRQVASVRWKQETIVPKQASEMKLKVQAPAPLRKLASLSARHNGAQDRAVG
jgi:hypothetical protein